MKGSENLWNEDELLAQLEEMQDQIDSLLKEKDDLAREAKEQDKQLQDQEQMSSSERSKLQSALQQAQKKMQEQSEQIVKLSEADLILKDNKRLKEENARLQSEKEKSKKEAARVEEVCEARLQRKDWLMQKKRQEVEAAKAELKRKEEIAETMIRDTELLIQAKVDIREAIIRDDYSRRQQRNLENARKKWKAERKSLLRWGTAVSLYAMIVTGLLCFQSEAYRTALTGALRQTGNAIAAGCRMLLGLPEAAAGFSTQIPVPFLKTIVYWGVTIIIAGICIAAILSITIFLFRKIRDDFTLATVWPVFLTLGGITTIAAVFGNRFQKICSINMIYIGIVLWIIGSICWCVFKRKDTGEH